MRVGSKSVPSHSYFQPHIEHTATRTPFPGTALSTSQLLEMLLIKHFLCDDAGCYIPLDIINSILRNPRRSHTNYININLDRTLHPTKETLILIYNKIFLNTFKARMAGETRKLFIDLFRVQEVPKYMFTTNS